MSNGQIRSLRPSPIPRVTRGAASRDNDRQANNAREHRRRRAAVLQQRRASGTLFNMRRSRPTQHDNNETSEDDSLTDDENSQDVDLVQQHFHRMRSRLPRLPLNSNLSGQSNSQNQDGEDIRSGVLDFNTQGAQFPLEPFEFKYPNLDDSSN